jgi:TRAP-type transport system periplasmic protein
VRTSSSISGRRALTIAAAVLLASGCGSASRRSTVTLRLATNEPEGIQHLPALERFVARVGALSHGALRIRVDLELLKRPPQGGGGYPIGQRDLLTEVRGGLADLAWVDTGVFDTLGVQDFDALGAPLLIDDYATEAAVLRSSIPGEMLGGARRLGVEALAVLAGRVMRPLGVGRALRAPADYRGINFRTLDSRLHTRALRALGARVGHEQYSIAALMDDIRSGFFKGLEEDLDTQFFELPPDRARYLTADVDLWPRTAAIVVDPRRFAGLTSQQQGWVRRAARDAALSSTTMVDDDAELAREFCADGGRLAVAGAAARAALARALAPVDAELRRRPVTRAFIRRIEAIKRRVRPSPPLAIPAGCTTATRPVTDPKRPRATTIPDGVYRVRITPADLRAAAAQPVTPENYGTLTLTLAHGGWTLEKREPAAYLERGIYWGTPERAMFVSTYAPDLMRPSEPAPYSLTFSREALRIDPMGNGDNVFYAWYAAHAWTKIG